MMLPNAIPKMAKLIMDFPVYVISPNGETTELTKKLLYSDVNKLTNKICLRHLQLVGHYCQNRTSVITHSYQEKTVENRR